MAQGGISPSTPWAAISLCSIDPRHRTSPGFGGSAAPSGANPPLGVHLSYLDDPTAATITWYTAYATTSRAEWGRSVGPPYPFHKAGDDYASPGGIRLHVVNLTGLTPGATYFYRVGDASMASTFGQATFRAAPPKGASDTFTFAAAGDWGDTVQTAVTSSGIAKRNRQGLINACHRLPS